MIIMNYYMNKASSRAETPRPDAGGATKRPGSCNFKPGVKSAKMAVGGGERPGLLQTPVLRPSAFGHSDVFYRRNQNYGSNKENVNVDDAWGDVLDEPFDFDQPPERNSVIDRNIEKRCATPNMSVRSSFSGPNKIVPQPDKSRYMQRQQPVVQLYQSPRLATPQKKQTVLNTETPRLSYQLKAGQKEAATPDACEPTSFVAFVATPQNKQKAVPTIYPKWSPRLASPREGWKDSGGQHSFPRMFTVSVQRLQSWPRDLTADKVVIEVFGIMDQVTNIPKPRSKKFILKGIPRGNIQCTFYEMDRTFPLVVKGQWHRCAVMLRLQGELQCLSIRPAHQEELKLLDSMQALGSRAAAKLLRAAKDP